MPKLTEVLLAGNKPIRKFANYKKISTDKEFWPLVLRDHVVSRKPPKGKAACVDEMSDMLRCLKTHDYSQTPCSREIASYQKCQANFMIEHQKRKEDLEKGTVRQGGKVPGKVVNEMLQKFSNPKT